MLRRKVMVILYRKNPALEVLLLKRVKKEKGDWHPITGNVERHESIPAAAVRETEEETGLAVTRPEPLGVTFTYEHGGQRYHETAFAISVSNDAKVTLSDEHTESTWLSGEAALAKLQWPEQKRALEALMKR